MKSGVEHHLSNPAVHPDVQILGFDVYSDLLSVETQRALLDDLRAVVRQAPLFSPITRGGGKMSVQMTSAGKYGWFSDSTGYRYARNHPEGMAWPPIPEAVLSIWRQVAGTDRLPDCCLINFYGVEARMGLHQDRDEADFRYPVVSVSLGDDGLFRVGGTARSDPTKSIWLHSGDVVVMGGAARLAFHGVDRIRPGSSALLSKGGRINVTLRVVD